MPLALPATLADARQQRQTGTTACTLGCFGGYEVTCDPKEMKKRRRLVLVLVLALVLALVRVLVLVLGLVLVLVLLLRRVLARL